MQPCYLMPHGNDAETVELPAYTTFDKMTVLYVTAYELHSILAFHTPHAAKLTDAAACQHTSTQASMQLTVNSSVVHSTYITINSSGFAAYRAHYL